MCRYCCVRLGYEYITFETSPSLSRTDFQTRTLLKLDNLLELPFTTLAFSKEQLNTSESSHCTMMTAQSPMQSGQSIAHTTISIRSNRTQAFGDMLNTKPNSSGVIDHSQHHSNRSNGRNRNPILLNDCAKPDLTGLTEQPIRNDDFQRNLLSSRWCKDSPQNERQQLNCCLLQPIWTSS